MKCKQHELTMDKKQQQHPGCSHGALKPKKDMLHDVNVAQLLHVWYFTINL